MLKWINASFKRKVFILLLGTTLSLSILVLSKYYNDEKNQLDNILHAQVTHLAHRFSLTVSNDVRYNKYFNLSDHIINLYDYNLQQSVNKGSLYKIIEIAILDTNARILGHSSPQDYSLQTLYQHRLINQGTLDEAEQLQLHWKDSGLLSVRAPILFETELVGLLILDIDPFILKQQEQTLLTNMMYMVILLISALSVIAIILSKWIEMPLVAIMGELDQLGDGGVTFPQLSKRGDEFFILSSALMKIDKNLHVQNQKLLENQKNLEVKVRDRTAELQVQANALAETIDKLTRSQIQLIESEKMSALGSLVAGVSHEINNPTNFVHVSAQNLHVDLDRFREYLIELTGEDVEQGILDSFHNHFEAFDNHLSTIKHGTERIKIIVQDLRAFSQLDSAEQKTVKVTDLLQSTINLVKAQYLDLTEFVIDFSSTPMLPCYPAQLNQVFMNLIVNACSSINEKHKQQYQQDNKLHGKVIIACREVGDIVQISVKDNGCGMTDETKSKLFEPFFTTMDVGEGTGLGLSIAYGIVQKHHGELTVTSRLGEGSEFILQLNKNWHTPDVK